MRVNFNQLILFVQHNSTRRYLIIQKKILEVKNLIKNYTLDKKEISILKGIDFTMYAGDFASIQGVSGVGKSTFLNLIGAVDSFNSGEIFMDGQNLKIWESKQQLHLYRRDKIGFIFQHHYLIPDFTVFENLCIPLLLKGKAKKETHKKAISLLEEIGLIRRKDHFPHQISGGESQRVSMIRAIIHEPSLILADEPTGNLDIGNTLNFIEILKKLQQKRELSILVTTHEAELANSARSKYKMIDGNIEK